MSCNEIHLRPIQYGKGWTFEIGGRAFLVPSFVVKRPDKATLTILDKMSEEAMKAYITFVETEGKTC